MVGVEHVIEALPASVSLVVLCCIALVCMTLCENVDMLMRTDTGVQCHDTDPRVYNFIELRPVICHLPKDSYRDEQPFDVFLIEVAQELVLKYSVNI